MFSYARNYEKIYKVEEEIFFKFERVLAKFRTCFGRLLLTLQLSIFYIYQTVGLLRSDMPFRLKHGLARCFSTRFFSVGFFKLTCHWADMMCGVGALSYTF